ncbi:hypothetical protein EYB26_009932 [Talaromyces marneffei]|uniref:uncharacterized protein n=1 Tax=Talaromyces marneffei TaxID=37727 RepID=UPI0012A79033|nr:uncharacterized protein EYB26_009932 [Talaromyces marneffei]QGA22216.1 hypothetical protein EYB26_009932 [Talaromyces marneffei]
MTTAAATLGQRLLDEIKEESLDELLHDLRNHFPSHKDDAFFGIKDLDELLNVFLGPKRRKPVIEISSPSSGGGKSQLVYYLIAMSVLPASFNGHKLDGRGGAVVLVDTDGRLDVQRLYDIIESVIQHALDGAETSGDATNELATLIRDTLQNIHIFRPQTSTSLLSTLKSLDTYLLDHPKTSSSRHLHGIFLDSASAFYWSDRLRDEIARTTEIGRPAAEIQQRREQRTSFYMSVLYHDIAAELRRLQGVFECGVVYTTWGITPRSSSSSSSSSSALGGGGWHGNGIWQGPPTFKPHLPAPWNSTFPDLRLVVQRDHVRTYPATSTISEWERDAPIRQSVVQKGKFSAWVDTSNMSAWASGEAVLSALRKMPDNGGFPFWVRENGVFMDDLMDDVS